MIVIVLDTEGVTVVLRQRGDNSIFLTDEYIRHVDSSKYDGIWLAIACDI